MNRFLTLLIFMSFYGFSATFAQEDTIRVFYDQNWKVISDPAKAAFHRVAYNNENGFWQVSDDVQRSSPGGKGYAQMETCPERWCASESQL